MVKILEGLHYLHQSDVVHCDLKAANILTTKTGNVKLSDFGVSLNLRAMEREFKDVAGTPNWMAPEVIELKGPSTKADIWSLACTVIELLTGRPPYADIANSMSGKLSGVSCDEGTDDGDCGFYISSQSCFGSWRTRCRPFRRVAQIYCKTSSSGVSTRIRLNGPARTSCSSIHGSRRTGAHIRYIPSRLAVS